MDPTPTARVGPPAPGAASGTDLLPPGRLREIGKRLACGFYERTGVLDSLVRRLAADPEFTA